MLVPTAFARGRGEESPQLPGGPRREPRQREGPEVNLTEEEDAAERAAQKAMVERMLRAENTKLLKAHQVTVRGQLIETSSVFRRFPQSVASR